jgi:hypothetical protein
MKTLAQITFALLALAATLHAQGNHYYDLAQERGPATIHFSVGTLLGPLKGDDRFHGAGDLGLEVASATFPFGTGRLMTASTGPIVMVEPEIHGWIPNPIPGFPHLADVYFRGAECYFDSSTFPIDPATGNYTGGGTITFTAGEIELNAISTSTIMPLAGLGSDIFQISGSLNQFGGKVEFTCSFAHQFVGDVGGFSIAVDLGGVLYGATTIPGLALSLNISTLTAGQLASFDCSGGLPQSPIYLGASTRGTGSNPINALHVICDLLQPIPVKSGLTDAAGNCSWAIQVPNFPGLSVWFQTIQMGLKSPVVATAIQ